jgi:hypothetical protein
MNLPPHQRGAAALSVTLLLLFVLTLVVGFASRNLVFEQRSSANQARSTQAFEAAEAGLQWAQAMLDSGTPIGADCEPSALPGDTSFRDRFLAYDAAGQRFAPRTWDDAGTPAALQAACVRGESGWSCSCPDAGHPTPNEEPASMARPAFVVRFAAAPRRGMVQVLSAGCDDLAPACAPGSPAAPSAGASAHVQVLLGLLPALATVPVAALTAEGDIAADGERLLARWLGLDRTRWQQLPGTRRLDCQADCGADLAQAIGPETASQRMWIGGDLRLDGPLSLGSAERPLLLVVEGQIRLGSGVQLHGAIVCLAASCDGGSSPDAQLHGALIALGDPGGGGAPTIVYDAAVLARLHGQVGGFTRVPGSWRDF